jgi:hypothetical protein
MFTDTRIENAVRAALEGDPRIRHPELIAVSADEIGTVGLQGAVDSLPSVWRRGKTRDRSRGSSTWLSTAYVDPHRGARGPRGRKSAPQQRLGPLGHMGIALESTRLGNGYARETIVDDFAHLELSFCRQRERPGPLEGGPGFRPVIKSDADPLEPRLIAVAHASGCDHQWALQVVQETLGSSPEPHLTIAGAATGAHDEQVAVLALRHAA